MEQSSGKKTKTKLVHLSLQSLAFFLITYYVSYFISGLSVLYIAYDFDIPATLYKNSVQYAVDETSKVWTSDATTSILMATPVSSFVVSIVSIFIFMVIRRKGALFLYACIWLFLQAFNMSFGLISENIITQTGLVRVANQMGIKTAMMMITIGISVFLMIKSGVFISKLFYAHCDTELLSRRSGKTATSLAFFFVPWFAGSLTILLLAGEDLDIKDFILSGFMMVLLLPALFVRKPENHQRFPVTFTSTLPLMILASIATLISYYLLHKGISF